MYMLKKGKIGIASIKLNSDLAIRSMSQSDSRFGIFGDLPPWCFIYSTIGVRIRKSEFP